MMLIRNGHNLSLSVSIDDRERVFLAVAAAEMNQEEFFEWVRLSVVRKRA
jgi:hypothetical protein